MKIGIDKFKHFAVSFVGSCFMAIAGLLIFGLPAGPIIAFIIMLLIGIFYEIYQKISGKGTFEWLDMLADVIGCIIGSGVVLLFN